MDFSILEFEGTLKIGSEEIINKSISAIYNPINLIYDTILKRGIFAQYLVIQQLFSRVIIVSNDVVL